MLPGEDIDVLRFTALPEGMPGGLLGTDDDARVVYSRQMLTNKKCQLKTNGGEKTFSFVSFK